MQESSYALPLSFYIATGLDAFKYLEVGYLRMLTIGLGNHHLEVAGGYGFGKLHLFVGWD